MTATMPGGVENLVRAGLRRADLIGARGWLATRPVRAPLDRRRHPFEPSAVVIDTEEEPARMAERGKTALYVGMLRRFATCTGVGWLDTDHVVTAYLLTGSIAVYRSPTQHAAPTQRMWCERGILGGAVPTTLAVNREGTLVAIPFSTSAATPAQVAIARVDVASGCVDLDGATVVPSTGDRNLHGVDFTPDGRFLVWSSIDLRSNGLRIVPLCEPQHTGGPPTVGPATSVVNDTTEVPPKGVAMSPDGRFIALAHGANASFGKRRAPSGRLDVRVWSDGMPGEVVSTVTADMVCPEDVSFHPSGHVIAVTDQIDERAHLFAIDPSTGRVEPTPLATISWAGGGLSAPHACAFSPDGNWLAITNYGDGSLRYFDSRSW
jgi:WD40 repeat protein